MTFGNIWMAFLQWKNYNKYCILLETTFEVPVKLVTIASMVYAFLAWSTDEASKKLYAVFLCVASSLVSFFNISFSKYKLKTPTLSPVSYSGSLKCK